jgi:hypothetical protein
MHVGIVEIDLILPGLGSLKEKRYVMRSLRDRIRTKFNVSVAEIDHQDVWQRARLGIAAVSNDESRANSVLSRAVNLIERDSRVQILDYGLRFL